MEVVIQALKASEQTAMQAYFTIEEAGMFYSGKKAVCTQEGISRWKGIEYRKLNIMGIEKVLYLGEGRWLVEKMI